MSLMNMEDSRHPHHLLSETDFLECPVVDLWARELAKALLKKFQTLTFRRNEFSALLTIDTDQPFAYLGKNLLSSIGGLFRDLTTSNGHPGDRYRIVVKGEKDPYEVFDYITEILKSIIQMPDFFFLSEIIQNLIKILPGKIMNTGT